ncbi:MAG: hypothetical protein ACJAYU_001535 [Bradymonadia bacterium]|jgi:hypothetical protein
MIRWQELRTNRRPFKRTKVTDGWMVWTGYGPSHPGKMTFYHDPSHCWQGDMAELE